MSAQDEEYFRTRAMQERQAALDSSKSEVALIHQELARLYDALAERPELRTRHAA